MKIAVLASGKLRERYAKLGAEVYVERIRKMIPFELIEVPESRGARPEKTGPRLAARLRDEDRVALLAADGTQHTSEGFASVIRRAIQAGRGRYVLVVGGPYGAGAAIEARAAERFSLGRMTLPHELARLVLLEQLYRALTIIRGGSYHHGDNA